MKVRLGQIARARSGDKGSGANVGLIALTDNGYAVLRDKVNATDVESYFKPMGVGTVTRYEWAGIGAMNFMLPDILAGGGSRSLRIDAQGKALGQVLLEMEVELTEDEYKRCLPEGEQP